MAEAKELKNGYYFVYNGELLKVNKRELVAYGTHSHTKLKFFVENLFKGNEKVINLAHTDSVEIVNKIIDCLSKAYSKIDNCIDLYHEPIKSKLSCL